MGHLHQYRYHRKSKLTQVFKEDESDIFDHYTEICFDNEKETDEQQLDFKTKFKLFNGKPTLRQKAAY